jgi:hypothetical protein
MSFLNRTISPGETSGSGFDILKTGENVLQKQETQFDNDFPISENANDTNTPKSDQQETPTNVK